jgi:hypothetical protein
VRGIEFRLLLLGSLIEQSHEFIGRQTGLADDAPYNRFGEIEPLVIRNSNPARPNRMLQVNVGATDFLNIKATLL